MSSSAFVTDAEFTAWINEGAQQLHEKLVDAMGEEYISMSTSFTTVSGTSQVSLPVAFYKLYGVDLTIDGNVRTLRPYMRAERNNLRNGGSRWVHEIPRYSLVGPYIKLQPAPTGAFAGTIYYAPVFTLLVAGTDECNFPNGWERYVVLYAAIQALAKEESSTTTLMALLERESRNIDAIKEQRDLAFPKQAIDLDLVLSEEQDY
jgi:hypothetical protein